MNAVAAKKGNTFYAAIILASTTIGTGFIGVPTVTGIAGFWPAFLMTLISWLFLTLTALLYAETILTMPVGANVFTTCRRYIGSIGCIVGVLSISFVNFPFISSYFVIGNTAFESLTTRFFGWSIDPWLSILLILLLTIWFLYLGIHVCSRINLIFFGGCFITLGAIVLVSLKAIDLSQLRLSNWTYVFAALAMLTNSLGSNLLIPTLVDYVGRERRKCLTFIWVGMIIPALLIILWQGFVIASVSRVVLWDAFEGQATILSALSLLRPLPTIGTFYDLFLIFAFSTSIIGVGLALIDFIFDGIKISYEERVGFNRLWVTTSIFLPPALLAWLAPNFVWYWFAKLASWGQPIFSGVIPIWLAIAARYFYKTTHRNLLPGGRTMIAILVVCTFFLFYLQGINLIRTS